MYSRHIKPNPDLDRRMVSFQANKSLPFFNWLKYKEGFSAHLIEYIIDRFSLLPGKFLDPFAGVGTSLFVARSRGWDCTGIELLPIGVFAIKARLGSERIRSRAFAALREQIRSLDFADLADPEFNFKHIPITEGAFAPATEREISGFRSYCDRVVKEPNCRRLLHLACLAILEEISYTRKDGQYLRWDRRARKSAIKSNFNKGRIQRFRAALDQKLEQLYLDITESQKRCALFSNEFNERGVLDLYEGTCLGVLPGLPGESIDLVVTSPPYCNRYDYTRTYALELAYLGVCDKRIRNLRQEMLSCTVENSNKDAVLSRLYARIGDRSRLNRARTVFDRQMALHEVLENLKAQAKSGELNNPNIPRMVRNYFLEMSVVISELARVLKPGGRIVMVNDNVRYGGQEVPVDLILSDFAEKCGLSVEIIWTLPRGKGNSSQQMGEHGRSELRKCVYVWAKPLVAGRNGRVSQTK